MVCGHGSLIPFGFRRELVVGVGFGVGWLTPRAEGATSCGVPSGSTRMAWVMFCTMAEPGAAERSSGQWP